jgi:uncharacterized protein YeaO (DUF488 family)
MVNIKRIYDPTSPQDGKRILIDRLWPRGVRREEAHIDEWLRDIAPSDELRERFGHDLTRWPQFRSGYAKELGRQCDALAELRQQARQGTVTLLFSAADPAHNNAVVLKEVLEEGAPITTGFVC